MLFKKFRRFVRAKARRQRAIDERNRKMEREWADRELEYHKKIEAEKDEAFYSVESAFRYGGIGFPLHETVIIAVRDFLKLTGWSFDPDSSSKIENE